VVNVSTYRGRKPRSDSHSVTICLTSVRFGGVSIFVFLSCEKWDRARSCAVPGYLRDLAGRAGMAVRLEMNDKGPADFRHQHGERQVGASLFAVNSEAVQQPPGLGVG